MMKELINNAFSTKMLQGEIGETFNLSFTLITEEEFREAIQRTENENIIIGHEDTAEYFNVPLNRQTIVLQDENTLYVCEANAHHGGRLPSGTEFLKQMGENFHFRYWKIILGE